MTEKCNRDCFNCIYDDCIVHTASKEERQEIAERNKRNMGYGISHIPKRSNGRKHRSYTKRF